MSIHTKKHSERNREIERDLNINGLEIYEEEITSNKTYRNPKSKSTKTQYSTEEPHLKSPPKKKKKLKNQNFPTNQTTPDHKFPLFLFPNLENSSKPHFPGSSSSPQITDPLSI